MARLVYYVAQSLDGYIADAEGGVAFLDVLQGSDAGDHGYAEFYRGVDSLVMGRATYEGILGFGVPWPYAGKPTWVMSSHELATAQGDVLFSPSDPSDVLRTIREAGHDETWLVGGGRLAAAFADEGLITQWVVSVVPYLLGAGIPVVAPALHSKPLTLKAHTAFSSGLVQLVYE